MTDFKFILLAFLLFGYFFAVFHPNWWCFFFFNILIFAGAFLEIDNCLFQAIKFVNNSLLNMIPKLHIFQIFLFGIL